MGSQDCVKPHCYSLQNGAAVGANISPATDGADQLLGHIMHLVTQLLMSAGRRTPRAGGKGDVREQERPGRRRK